LEELKNQELYLVKKEQIEDDFKNISIINEGIKNLIKEIFNVESNEKKEFILGNYKIITKSISNIIEGKLITFDCNYYLSKENSINFNGDVNNLNICFNNYINILILGNYIMKKVQVIIKIWI